MQPPACWLTLPSPAIYLAGDILGVIAANVLFDWALIHLTSLSGALLIMEGLNARRDWLVGGDCLSYHWPHHPGRSGRGRINEAK